MVNDTIGQVRLLNAKELRITSKRGPLSVTVDGETQIIEEGKAYHMYLHPENGSGARTLRSRRRTGTEGKRWIAAEGGAQPIPDRGGSSDGNRGILCGVGNNGECRQSERSDEVDFDESILGKTSCLDGRAGWWSGNEVARIDFVHGREVVHVPEENSGLYDVIQRDARRFENGLQIFQDAFGLLANVGANKLVGLGIECDLAGNKNETVGFNRLGIGPDGLGAAVGKNDVFHGVLS
jgi:hypothetical protein